MKYLKWFWNKVAFHLLSCAFVVYAMLLANENKAGLQNIVFAWYIIQIILLCFCSIIIFLLSLVDDLYKKTCIKIFDGEILFNPHIGRITAIIEVFLMIYCGWLFTPILFVIIAIIASYQFLGMKQTYKKLKEEKGE